ncbi:MAG: hypothetical protein ABIT96_05520 [Ferruginibacter sp.]
MATAPLNKYLALLVRLAAMVIIFVILLALLMLGLRFIFGLVGYTKWVSVLYSAIVLALPTVFFISVYTLYFKRTIHHPSNPVRIISRIIFVLAIISWITIFVLDARNFLTGRYEDIEGYLSFEVYILAANVSLLFLVAIFQALTTGPEKDWRDRAR